jgi:hypothetical protein
MMTRRSTMRLTLPAVAALSLLAACHKAPQPAKSLDAIDNDLVNGAVVADTPANKALAADIKVDPTKAGKFQPNDRPATVSLAEVSERQRHGQSAMPAVTETGDGTPVGGGSGCLEGLAYGNGWAAKLPADLPMHPAARLEEAAGHDGPCRARVVSFTVLGDRGQVLGWYTEKAKAAGYQLGRDDKGGDWILVGDKGTGAFSIIIGTPTSGATPVDYVWTGNG